MFEQPPSRSRPPDLRPVGRRMVRLGCQLGVVALVLGAVFVLIVVAYAR